MKSIKAKHSMITQKYLDTHYEGDIYNYMDTEWGNVNWMTYKNGIIILNYEDGEVYFVEIV